MSPGKRRNAPGEERKTVEGFTELSASSAKCAWARRIKQVYEVDSLECPRCNGAMRLIAFIEQPDVIKKIPTHLGLWPAPAQSPPVASIAA